MTIPALFSELVPDYFTEEEYLCLGEVSPSHHGNRALLHQCSSLLVQKIRAPAALVWSVVRRFDEPQMYKNFIKSCRMMGDGSVGSIRKISLVSGIPARNSTERLDILDDEKHVLGFSVLGGDHRLNNYRSTTSLHEIEESGSLWTKVIETYVVDIPDGNTYLDTTTFVDTVIKCNLQSLAQLLDRQAKMC